MKRLEYSIDAIKARHPHNPRKGLQQAGLLVAYLSQTKHILSEVLKGKK